jgi:hypothetical protein
VEFAGTHTVAAGGAPTWATADPSTAMGPALAPHLEVQVLQEWGSFAQVRCSNGWEAWTDLRLLAPHGATTTAAPAGATAATAGTRRATPGTNQKLAAAGGVLAAVGAFLPWYSFGSRSINGFDVSLWALLSGKASESSPSAGLVMVLAVGAVAALFTELPWWAYGLCGNLALCVALAGIGRMVLAADPKPSIGIGLWIGLAGGALIQYAHHANAKTDGRARRAKAGLA